MKMSVWHVSVAIRHGNFDTQQTYNTIDAVTGKSWIFRTST